MSKFYLFGKYSQDALKHASSDRTKKAVEIIEGFGGKVLSMDILVGEKDLVMVVDLPNTVSVIKASVELIKMTGIGFSSSPAMPVEDFDKLIK
ncbi:GYD domain-containing protein [Elusimicrobiota bacterium]